MILRNSYAFDNSWHTVVDNTITIKYENHNFIFVGGKDVDAPDSISPKYTTQWKSEFALDMAKQSGREQIISGTKKNDLDSNIVANHLDGEDDREWGMKLASDMTDGVDRGTFHTSKSKRIPIINMALQSGKNVTEERRVDDRGNVLEEDGILELDLNKYDKGAHSSYQNYLLLIISVKYNLLPLSSWLLWQTSYNFK